MKYLKLSQTLLLKFDWIKEFRSVLFGEKKLMPDLLGDTIILCCHRNGNTAEGVSDNPVSYKYFGQKHT